KPEPVAVTCRYQGCLWGNPAEKVIGRRKTAAMVADLEDGCRYIPLVSHNPLLRRKTGITCKKHTEAAVPETEYQGHFIQSLIIDRQIRHFCGRRRRKDLQRDIICQLQGVAGGEPPQGQSFSG